MNALRRHRWLPGLALLAAIVPAAVGLVRHYLPSEIAAAGGVYDHYRSHAGIDATYVRQWRVNDTLRVNATVLQARDSATWEWLKDEFSLWTPAADTTATLTVGLAPLPERFRHGGCAFACLDYQTRSALVFEAPSATQRDAMVDYVLEKYLPE